MSTKLIEDKRYKMLNDKLATAYDAGIYSELIAANKLNTKMFKQSLINGLNVTSMRQYAPENASRLIKSIPDISPTLIVQIANLLCGIRIWVLESNEDELCYHESFISLLKLLPVQEIDIIELLNVYLINISRYERYCIGDLLLARLDSVNRISVKIGYLIYRMYLFTQEEIHSHNLGYDTAGQKVHSASYEKLYVVVNLLIDMLFDIISLPRVTNHGEEKNTFCKEADLSEEDDLTVYMKAKQKAVELAELTIASAEKNESSKTVIKVRRAKK